jgi:hypothetical protein
VNQSRTSVGDETLAPASGADLLNSKWNTVRFSARVAVVAPTATRENAASNPARFMWELLLVGHGLGPNSTIRITTNLHGGRFPMKRE